MGHRQDYEAAETELEKAICAAKIALQKRSRHGAYWWTETAIEHAANAGVSNARDLTSDDDWPDPSGLLSALEKMAQPQNSEPTINLERWFRYERANGHLAKALVSLEAMRESQGEESEEWWGYAVDAATITGIPNAGALSPDILEKRLIALREFEASGPGPLEIANGAVPFNYEEWAAARARVCAGKRA